MSARFSLRRRIEAPRERVWQAYLGLLLGPDGQPDYAVEGDPPPHGPGAVKVFQLSGRELREETTAFDPPRFRAYRIVAGAPVDEYTAETTLTEAGGATELLWEGRARAADPAAAEAFVRQAEQTLAAAVAAIARRAEAGSS